LSSQDVQKASDHAQRLASVADSLHHSARAAAGDKDPKIGVENHLEPA